jgi:hypothetical protein
LSSLPNARRDCAAHSVRSRTLLLGALAATAALLAACSTGPSPLSNGGWSGSDCIPSRLYSEPTVGFWLLDNTGTSPVTVTSVKLPSHGLAMTKAWLVPQYKSHNTTDYLGTQASYPPTRYRTWPDRQPIPGAVIKPGQELNLIFGVTRTGSKDGTTDGPVITYTAGRITYTLQADFGIILIAPHGHCPR